MTDFTDYNTAVKLLKDAQEAEEDNRNLAKEAHLFITKKDGQWEQMWWDKNNGQPRYTFDQTSPIIDQIAGDIEDSDFEIKIKPTGGTATKEGAILRDGIIRNIEDISDAQAIYSTVGRNVATAGIDHIQVVTDYVDADSFDQDLIIKPVHDSPARVWFGPSQRQDRADSKYYFLLSAIPKDEAQDLAGDRTVTSVTDGTKANAYYHKEDNVIIGHIFYQKLVDRELIRTSLGRILNEDDLDFIKIKDGLVSNEVVKDTRIRQKRIFYMRKFDGSNWIGKEEKTVFSLPSIIPVYGNFKVIETKTVYHGAVLKIMDSQRVFNYSLSREIGEGALAPRAKYWMTRKQAKGETETLRTLNTNPDPVQFYNADGEVPPPVQQGGAQINPGLRIISDNMQLIMGRTAGIFAAGMGDNPGLQSGIAIDKLQNKSNNITSKYFKSIEIGVCAVTRVIETSLPEVYDAQREVRSMDEDGSFEMIMINQEVKDESGTVIIDQRTGNAVIINALSPGSYSIKCKAGKSFDSKQGEANEAILDVAVIDPSIVTLGSDVILKNMSAPGTDIIAERRRKELFDAGKIPEDQFTDDERAQAEAAAQQPQQPDAMMIAAQAEQSKADAEMAKVQIANGKNQIEMMKAQNNIGLEIEKLNLMKSKMEFEGQKAQFEFSEKIAKLDKETQKQEFDQMIALRNQAMQASETAVNNVNTQANTLKTLRDAMGVETIVGPGNQAAYINQAHAVLESQNQT